MKKTSRLLFHQSNMAILRQYVKEDRSVKRKAVNYVSYFTLTAGALLLFWSFYPILSFQIYSFFFITNTVRSPVPHTDSVSSLTEAQSVLGTYSIFSNNLRDFTQASLWFPTSINAAQTVQNSDVKEYYLTIPKLNIQNAKVAVGGEDLSKSLVHYLPQSLPGQPGKVSIFGHSTLPSLYNVNDYKTIFTYLPSLQKGDRFSIKILDTTYEYEITSMYVVKPDQVSVLEQKRDASYVTLITCVPPGTYWERLVVEARMVESTLE